MNAYAYINMELEKNNRKYIFQVPIGSPFAECHEILHQLGLDIVEMEKKSKEQEGQLTKDELKEIPQPEVA